MMRDKILKLLLENLGLKGGERLLVFTDLISNREPRLAPHHFARREKTRILAQQVAEVARSITDEVVYHEYKALGHHGVEPPESLWGLAFGEEGLAALKERRLLSPLLKKEDHRVFSQALEVLKGTARGVAQVVVALANYSTTHTSFRKLLTEMGARYASMPLFDVEMLNTSLDVDLKKLEKVTLGIAQILDQGEKVEITAPNGTHFTLSIEGRKATADTGNLSCPGSFGNLPAGEAFIAPVEGTAQGVFVAEWGSTRELDVPTAFHIQEGQVTKVEGDAGIMQFLEDMFQKYHQARNIAELGIGTNPKASKPDNILEAEKIAGTIHLALGDNSTFGGQVKVPFHQDFVLFKPTVKVIAQGEGREILREGRCIEP
ncbi:MAG TPA: aminopeptidase [Thermosulfidibacter takaii]|uniref:Aminopeptidase n=1 Tax=Thermosulfidibacter takaii TaxID=412593 RepID=A0A7C0Y8B0_9BACT|nr:aminopeptidase [Thermosulfidibacter takaii]